jgi:hypothetical protein
MYVSFTFLAQTPDGEKYTLLAFFLSIPHQSHSSRAQNPIFIRRESLPIPAFYRELVYILLSI